MPLTRSRWLWLAAGLVAAGLLGYLILVVRWLSVMADGSSASFLLCGALIGLPFSGAILSRLGGLSHNALHTAFSVHAGLFAVSTLACLVAAVDIGQRALDLAGSSQGWLTRSFLMLLVALPPFFASGCIGFVLQRYAARLGRAYGIMLIGAGIGAAAVVIASFVISLGAALMAVAVSGVLAAFLSLRASSEQPRWASTGLLLTGVALFAMGLTLDLEPQPHQGKPLSRWLRLPGVKVLDRRSGPFGQLTAITSPEIPFRHAPGLGPMSHVAIPEQLGIFVDGEGPLIIDRNDGAVESLDYLQALPSALPYQLLAPRPSVLILEAGGGREVRQALVHQAVQVDAIEVNPQMAEWMLGRFAAFSGYLYSDPRVTLHHLDPRAFVRAADRRWALIQLTYGESVSPFSSLLAFRPTRLSITREALQDYLSRLEPGGLLMISGLPAWPPYESLGLFATAIASLKSLGAEHIERRLAWVRSWQVSCLIIKNGEFTSIDVDRIRRFLRRNGLDEAYLHSAKPTIRGDQTASDLHFRAPALALLGSARAEVLRDFAHPVKATTDERPWPVAVRAELGHRLGVGRAGFQTHAELAGGVHAAIFMALLLLPILVFIRLGARTAVPLGRVLRSLIHLLATGLAFVFVALFALRAFTLYLAHPIFAIPVVLAGLLLFAGVGSGLSTRIPRWNARGRVVIAASVFALLCILYGWSTTSVFNATGAWPFELKLIVAIGFLAPLALCAGVMFPLAALRLSYQGPALIPSTFSIQSAAVVLGIPLATALCAQLGQSVLLPSAVVLSAVAIWSIP